MTGGILGPSASVKPPGLTNVGIQQNLNQQIPLDLTFRDETGKAVHLGDYIGKKPVILSLVYYRCPRSEEHTSELQSRFDLVCRLLLEKKKKAIIYTMHLFFS